MGSQRCTQAPSVFVSSRLDELDAFLSINENTTVGPPSAEPNTVTRGSFAQKATDLRASGIVNNRGQKSKPKIIVGRSSANTLLASVKTTREIDVFVSRLHPHSTMAEVEDCARTIVGDDIDIIEVHCNKLKARNEHLYSSFHLQIRVNAADMGRALDLISVTSPGHRGYS